MAGFTKLDSNIVDSSIWGEPYHRRIMWITFLAKKDHAGIVRASLSGMQRAANVTLEEAQDAIKCLESPDPDSRTPDNEGRRVQKIEGGWIVLNHKKYRDFSYSTSPEAIRQRNHRKKQNVTECDMSRTPRDISVSVSASVSASEEKKGTGEKIYTPECRAALHWLNEQSGKHFRESEMSLAPISARLKEAGVDIAGVRKMISRQCELWKGTRMQEYLRPETLFGKEKFNGYYAAKDLPVNFEEKKSPRHEQNGF